MKLKTNRLTALVLIVLMACAQYLPQIRTVEALFKTVATDLVAHKVITEDQKTKIFTDADDAINEAVTLSNSLAAATTDAQKFTAWKTAADGWLAIIGRGHFVNVPYLNDAVLIINGVFDAAVAFYDRRPGATVKPGVVRVANEGELKAHIKDELARAQRLLKAAK